MYVCLCNGYRDVEIREVAESGLRCVTEVYLTLGNGPCCGGCLDFAQDIVNSVHGDGGSSAGQDSQDSSERSEEHTSELQSLMRTPYAVFCLTKNIKDTNEATDAKTQLEYAKDTSKRTHQD